MIIKKETYRQQKGNYYSKNKSRTMEYTSITESMKETHILEMEEYIQRRRHTLIENMKSMIMIRPSY